MNEQEYEQRELAERHHRAAAAARAGQPESAARTAQAAEAAQSAEAATPDAVKEAEVSRQAVKQRLAQMRGRGVDWVRPTDLMAHHAGSLSRRGIDFTAEQSRRLRAPLEAHAQRIAERARRLPSLSAFGRRGTADQGQSRSGVGMR